MSTKPLENLNINMVFVALNDAKVADAIKPYGIPADPGNITPTVNIQRISNMTELAAFLALVPSPLLPWTVIESGMVAATRDAVRRSMTSYFGREQTVSSCLSMVPNDYAINPKLLRG